MTEQLGYQDPLVQKALDGKSPQTRAAELVLGSKLMDVAYREKLFSGGQAAITESLKNDPMVALAMLVDPEARKVRKVLESEYSEPRSQAYDKIAQAKFAVEGGSAYDATFTLRLSFGPVKGYVEEGKKIPFQTTYGGLYEYAAEKKNDEKKPNPFALPQRWIDRKSKLNLATPFMSAPRTSSAAIRAVPSSTALAKSSG